MERWRDQNAPEYSVKCYGTPMQSITVYLPSILENSEKKHTIHIKTDRAGIKFIILINAIKKERHLNYGLHTC